MGLRDCEVVTMKIAFLFPGQGAQKVGMGKDLYDTESEAKKVFSSADEALNSPLSQLIFEGPADDLTLTANTQPAILTVSIAAFRAFRQRSEVAPAFVAGHSLGEYSALVAAGAMEFSDAVPITRARGTFMQEAVRPGEGAMAAVMGSLTIDDIGAICTQATASAQGTENETVAPANINAPGQTVISGSTRAVDRATDLLKEAGAKVIPLQVSAPFHSVLMKPAAQRLSTLLEDIPFSTPQVPVVTNVEAKPNGDAARIRELLVQQVTAPVRWTESIQYMLESGVDTFFEFGPGNVLCGLLRRIDRSATSVAVNSLAGLDKALEILAKQ